MNISRPVTIFEAHDRFLNGKKVREDTWDYEIMPGNAVNIKNRYKLAFGKDTIPEDRDVMDRLFSAGVDMLVETGFFNPDTGKVMHVTEPEIFEGLKKASKRLRIGSGKDEVICERRSGNSPVRPIIQGGPTGTPVSEELFVTMIHAYAQEATVDALASGVMSTVDGHPPTSNTPWEIKATLAEIRAVREGAARAERPGMAIKGPETPLSIGGHLASNSGAALGKTDLHVCSQLNELKMDTAGLNIIAGWAADSNMIMMEQMPIFGGYCGGIEESAVCDVATTLASFAIFGANIHLDGPIHMKWGATTARETLQIAGHVAAAIDANTDLLIANQYYPAAGPCTEMCLLETAAQAITDTVSGREMLSGVASAKGVSRDKTTPMETRIMGETASAAAGMSVSDANEMIERLVSGYEDNLSHPPRGRHFQDCYDLKTITPTKEHTEVYENAVQMLKDLGLGLRY